MTAAEKTSLAHFLDMTAVTAGSGYRSGKRDYNFSDDPVPEKGGAVVHPGTGPDSLEQAGSLEQAAADIRACTACSLCKTRTNAVPGEGAVQPLVMVIGEGPGADEDASGRPFVGKAGILLDKMLASVGLSRERNCFIANVVKCRPPDNRDPLPEETAACASFLRRQVQLLCPHFILCVGRVAAQTLLDTTENIGRLRGSFIELHIAGLSIPLIATYHPSALLRNEELKRPAWEDLKILKARLDEYNQQSGGAEAH